jgi:hypothetical protein
MLRRLTARRSLCFLSPPDPFARNGLSLACNGCSLSKPPFQGQSSRPATSLSSASPPPPVRPSRSTAASGLPGPGCFYASGPLPLLPYRSVPLNLLPLPFGALTPRRINAFHWPRCTLDRLLLWPDLPSLPAALLLLLDRLPVARKADYGSPFQDRYLKRGWLIHKPLGTSFTMPPFAFPVNRFQFCNELFQQDFCVLFSNS